jgi:Flp pilus assembly protein TadD
MRRIVLSSLATASLALPAAAQHEHGAATETLGTVTFASSCAPAVQPTLNRAVAMLHSFWFQEAAATFGQVAREDPSCAMAHWGSAMTAWGNPFVRQPIPAERLQIGLAAAERAVALAAAATHREQMYASAALALWQNADSLDHLARMRRHEGAMKQLHDAHPEDPETAIFHARAVIANAPPDDLTFARQRFAATILQPLFGAQPTHPGLAHYIIHTFDSPGLASEGLAAARRYAEIAPAAPHALHMPSHIFTRLGLWDEVISTNRGVVTAALKHGIIGEALHGSDYQVFGHLQKNEDDLARRVIDAAPKLSDVPRESTMYFAGLYATASMPARYAVERRQWVEAAQLPEPAGFPGGRYAWADAAVYFARALGAARSGRVDQARRDTDTLRALHQTLVAQHEAYWATQVEIQQRAAASWLALAERRPDAALELARSAADLEDGTDKHPVTPGAIVPARDLLGQMLLELDRPGEAFAEFSRVLASEPNRFGALYGAARAAERSGDMVKARDLYAALVKVAPQSRRPEVQHARDILARTP